MTRRTGLTSFSGLSAITSGVVEQLGLAMIPLWPRRSLALTSGTTSGTSGSMRKAELLSMTTAPCRTASGATSRLTSPLAEMNTISTSLSSSAVTASTSISFPLTLSRLPTDRLDAHKRNSLTGKSRCSRMSRKTLPTAPVAPTTAILHWSNIRSPPLYARRYRPAYSLLAPASGRPATIARKMIPILE